MGQHCGLQMHQTMVLRALPDLSHFYCMIIYYIKKQLCEVGNIFKPNS